MHSQLSTFKRTKRNNVCLLHVPVVYFCRRDPPSHSWRQWQLMFLPVIPPTYTSSTRTISLVECLRGGSAEAGGLIYNTRATERSSLGSLTLPPLWCSSWRVSNKRPDSSQISPARGCVSCLTCTFNRLGTIVSFIERRASDILKNHQVNT